EEWSNIAADTDLRIRTDTGTVHHEVVAGGDYFREPRKYSEESIDFDDQSAYLPLDVFSPVYGTPLTPIQPVASGHTRSQYVGAYVQDRVELTQRLFVVAGGRLDFASNRDLSKSDANRETAFSPRLGASYRALPTVSVYGGYGHSFRPQDGLIYDGSTS